MARQLDTLSQLRSSPSVCGLIESIALSSGRAADGRAIQRVAICQLLTRARRLQSRGHQLRRNRHDRSRMDRSWRHKVLAGVNFQNPHKCVATDSDGDLLPFTCRFDPWSRIASNVGEPRPAIADTSWIGDRGSILLATDYSALRAAPSDYNGCPLCSL